MKASVKKKKFIGLTIVLAIFTGILTGCAQTKSTTDNSVKSGNDAFTYVYIGSRTTKERNARGKGISVYKVDKATGKWENIQVIEGIDNPSYLTLDKDKKCLYAVQGDKKTVAAYKIDKDTGMITFLNTQATGEEFVNSKFDLTKGFNPVTVTVDPTNKYVIIPNLGSGRIAVLPINEDGSLGKYVSLAVTTGAATRDGEESSFGRPHQAMFDATGKFVVVPMQGRPETNSVDKVVTYSFNSDTGEIKEVSTALARTGSWPRHISFAKNNKFAYVANEKENSVTTYTFDQETGALKAIQVLSTLPETFVGNNTASEIEVHPNGKFVYASNRGHDSIAIYKINEETGMLSIVGWESTQGKGPRFTAIDPSGKYFYAANEDGDNVVEFIIDQTTGKLNATGQIIETGSPTAIVFN